MILSRKKRKAKKLAKLEAAKEAAMANSMIDPMQYPRPPSAMSVPVFLHDSPQDDSDISDEDGMLDSISLSMERAATDYFVQKPPSPIQNVKVSQMSHSYTLPYGMSAITSMPNNSTLQTNPTPNAGLYRAPSQPALLYAPTTSVVPVEPQIHHMQTPMAGPAQVTTTHQQQQPPPSSSTTAFSQRNMSVKPNGPSNLLKASKAPKVDPAKTKQISLALSMGLGRGIDATSKTPWASKGSFQVRRVYDSIVETNEGSCINSYNHEIVSTTDMEQLLQTSLDPPENPVVINVEAEANRNINSSRRIVGKKVVTRTLSFQTDFEEKYSDGDSGRGTQNFLVPRDPAEVVYNTQNSSLTFEERVCQWLLHRIGHKYAIIGQKLEIRGDERPVETLAKMLHTKSIPKGEEEVIKGCKELVGGLRTTHYVTSITLGAAEYRIMSTGEYHKKLAQGGAFGIDTLATSATGEMIQTKKEATKCSQLRKLGVIKENGQAEKTPHDEVVLTVQLQPITRLIRLPVVKSAIKSALEDYMKKAPVKQEGGPFIIKCTGRNIYFTVNKFNNYEVEGTETPEEASLFYFKPTDDGGNPFDFNIVYFGEDVGPTTATEGPKVDAIGRYLEAPVNTAGHCPGPLLMKHCVKVRNTRFTLRSRLSKKYSQSHLSEWTTCEDAFYVACATRRFQHNSYLAIKSSNQTSVLGKNFYMTACLPSIHHHNGDNVMMLFQLLPKEMLVGKTEAGQETPGKLPSPE